jgi:WD40 repeat protein
METKKITLLKHKANLNAVAFSPDNLQLATADQDGVIAVWSVESGERAFEFKAEEPVFSLDFSMDGNLLAAGSRHTILIFDLLQQKNISSLEQVGEIKDIVFSADGKWLASASTESAVNLWAVENGAISASAIILQHSSEILSIDFSPDSTRLAVGCQNGFSYLWDIATADEIARFPHTDGVTGVSFSSDGALLATVSRNVVQIWDLSRMVPVTTQDIVETACSRLTSNFNQVQWQEFFYQEPYTPLCENLPGGE